MKKDERVKIIIKRLEEIYPTTPIPLDHQNAFLNYQARGMKIFKTEELKRKVV